jgi:hypothetical protein
MALSNLIDRVSVSIAAALARREKLPVAAMSPAKVTTLTALTTMNGATQTSVAKNPYSVVTHHEPIVRLLVIQARGTRANSGISPYFAEISGFLVRRYAAH